MVANGPLVNQFTGECRWPRCAGTTRSSAMRGAMDLSVEARRQYEDDAGAIRFDRVADPQLDQLRLRVAAALSK